jgi:hypothetical protein
VFIPSGPEFGDIDFKKLIIGPRGMTQKDMEQRFGCKILIRGRGSQRDGSSGMDGEDDELHAFVEGSAESVTQVLRRSFFEMLHVFPLSLLRPGVVLVSLSRTESPALTIVHLSCFFFNILSSPACSHSLLSPIILLLGCRGTRAHYVVSRGGSSAESKATGVPRRNERRRWKPARSHGWEWQPLWPRQWWRWRRGAASDAGGERHIRPPRRKRRSARND